MKNILLVLASVFSSYASLYSQCSPNPLYQDSTYNIWPDTVTNLPVAYQSVSYDAVLDVKTPSTLLEATGGDSSMLYLDTVVVGIQVFEFVGNWPVDSMELVSVSGMPNGLSFGCDVASCVLPGDILTCAYINGVTNDPPGIYPLTILVNVYTHGTIDLGFLQYPYATDLYSALGDYEEVPGYKIVVSDNSTSAELFNSNQFVLFQNLPNPTNEYTEIRFNVPSSEKIVFTITDILGNLIYDKEIHANLGYNSFEFIHTLPSGIYNYSIQYRDKKHSKKMIIVD